MLKQIEPLNLTGRVGRIGIATASVPVTGVYLTIAVRDGSPLDLVIAENIEDARANHEEFMLAADMMARCEEMGKAQATNLLN